MPRETVSLRINIEHGTVDAAARAHDKLARESARAATGMGSSDRAARGTSTSAREAANSVQRLHVEMSRVSEGGMRIGRTLGVAALAVVGLNTAEAGLRTTVRAVSDSIRAYIATNDEAKESTALLGESVTQFREALGEAVIGGENLDLILGTVTGTVQRLTEYVRDNREAIQGAVRNGFAALIDAGAVVIRTLGVLTNAFRLADLGVSYLKTSFIVTTSAAAALGLAFLDNLLRPVDFVVTGLRDAVATLANVARAMGAGGLADQLAGVSEAVGTVTANVDGLRMSLTEAATGAVAAGATALSELRIKADETTRAMVATDTNTQAWADSWRGVAADLRNGTLDIDAHALAIRDDGDAAREAAEPGKDLAIVFKSQAFAAAEAERNVDRLRAVFGMLRDAVISAGKASEQAGLDAALDRMKEKMQTAQDQGNSFEKNITGSLTNVQQFGSQAINLLIGGFTQMAGAIGQALVGAGGKGIDTFKAMLGDILVSLGSTAVAMGTMGLLGTVIPWLRAPMGPPAANAVLIGAGTAAIVAGSALGASARATKPPGTPAGAAPTGGGGGGTTNNFNVTLGAGIPRRAMQRGLVEEVSDAAMAAA